MGRLVELDGGKRWADTSHRCTAFFHMAASPTQTTTWLRLKEWFSEKKDVIMVNTILRDDPTRGDMDNKEELSPRRLWTAICHNYDLWPL